LLADNRGEPYVDSGKTRVPVEFTFLDPMKRIKELRVDVWTGNPGRDRAGSLTKPPAAEGDGLRESQKITYENGYATGTILLPKVPAGKVVWVQPVAVSTDKTEQWGTARTIQQFIPLERKSATLKVQLNAQEERTLRLKSSASLSKIKGSN